MQSPLEFFPLLAFLVAYPLGGIYVATAVLMASMALLLAIDYVRARKIPPMHGISAVLVFLFGAATLILHNPRFIQWKATVFFWLLSIALLGSMWIGRQPLVQRLLNPALEGQANVSVVTWRRVNLLWVVFYALLGAANLFVALKLSEAAWVKFKFIGLPLITLVFTAAQVAWLLRKQPAQVTSA